MNLQHILPDETPVAIPILTILTRKSLRQPADMHCQYRLSSASSARATRASNSVHRVSTRNGSFGRVHVRATTQQTQVDVEPYSGESFYDILGVSPGADVKEIKRAYYNIMRSCHPDRASASYSSIDGDDLMEVNEFCAMLNDIYEVNE